MRAASLMRRCGVVCMNCRMDFDDCAKWGCGKAPRYPGPEDFDPSNPIAPWRRLDRCWAMATGGALGLLCVVWLVWG